jgi:GNAT superfamily N-acetyltransferase
MNCTATPIALPGILDLRAQFLQENNFQIRYDSVHRRGWSTSWLITLDGTPIGYGSTMGQEKREVHDTIFEFYILPTHLHRAFLAFETLLAASKAIYVETQSNLTLLPTMLFTYIRDIVSHVTLFSAGPTTNLQPVNTVFGADPSTQPQPPGTALFRPWRDGDKAFDHTSEPTGDFVLAVNEEIVATGGFLLHYNAPFADLYMEVKPEHRQKGLGSYLIQELKRECYAAGRVPAARCNNVNTASRATLLKGGMTIAGNMLLGKINP